MLRRRAVDWHVTPRDGSVRGLAGKLHVCCCIHSTQQAVVPYRLRVVRNRSRHHRLLVRLLRRPAAPWRAGLDARQHTRACSCPAGTTVRTLVRIDVRIRTLNRCTARVSTVHLRYLQVVQAIRSDNPIIFFEHVLLYNIKGETHDGDYCQSLERAEVRLGARATLLFCFLNSGMLPALYQPISRHMPSRTGHDTSTSTCRGS
eukprot:GHRQ01024751.1.p1 GENE.GHRQ01024751.1~~GHRQ01024751.1.p1  ORF type:complete len:203 (+),score=11.82 GHRQ01024751.1:82-690(+)